jgi:transcription elongation factor GreB
VSRAFTSEDDQDRDEDVPEIRIPLPEGARNYMTPAGAEKLQAELGKLVNSVRPKLVAAVARTTAGSGTTDTDALRQERRSLRKVDRRIEYLNRMMAIGEIIDPAEQATDRVVFGATVTVSDQHNDQRTYQIVGVDESDPEIGKVSWISPVAKALTGTRLGEEVKVVLPGGESRLRVTKIEFR